MSGERAAARDFFMQKAKTQELKLRGGRVWQMSRRNDSKYSPRCTHRGGRHFPIAVFPAAAVIPIGGRTNGVIGCAVCTFVVHSFRLQNHHISKTRQDIKVRFVPFNQCYCASEFCHYDCFHNCVKLRRQNQVIQFRGRVNKWRDRGREDKRGRAPIISDVSDVVQRQLNGRSL